MNKNETKRRDWVKNAAIIFLTVMLVLTFFSNTIMNYSLPEVAGQSIQSGSITAKIRGTGTIESGDPYNVQINETRTVESVLVKSGDVVEKGAVLFILADKESDELTAAEDALAAAILDFEKAILSGDISNSVINNVQSGNISTVSQYQKRIQAAGAEIESRQKELDEVQAKINKLEADIKKLGYSSVDTTAEAKALFNAQNAYDKKNEELSMTKSALASLQSELVTAQNYVKDYEAGRYANTVSSGDAATEYDAAKHKTQVLPGRISEEQNNVTNLQSALYNLGVEVEKAQAALDTKKGNSGNINNLNIDLANWNLKLLEKQNNLQEAQDAKVQLLKDIGQELSMDAQSESIEKLRENVAELRANAVGAVIEAPVAGTITGVSITAGQDTIAGVPIATMQPEGKGYTMSFTVTNEQAKRLSVGVRAELTNYWRYDDVAVTLSSIKPDTAEPGQKKLLTFDVTGNVVSGQSLNISVGDKSANYDMIVPNSAIREDNNGNFILIVESKSGPLGSRRIATRVDVEVLARDDTQSAISGGVYGYEFVITTTTKPVEAGQQVRLADD